MRRWALVWPKHVVQRSVMRSGGIALASVRKESHEFATNAVSWGA
jgi:hypothetical protein